jgi:hypothetical protein
MIPNHPGFIEAIQQRRKVRVRFYSAADSGVLDRVCAPLDYGPGTEPSNGPNRYWLWDCAGASGSLIPGLVPQQIVEVRVLGETFDPVEIGVPSWTWAIPRDWGTPPRAAVAAP